MAASLIIYSKENLVVLTWNKNSSTSIHNYCRAHGFTENTDTGILDITYDMSLSVVQDPVIRWCKGFSTYVGYNNLGQSVRNAIYGKINGFRNIDVEGILLDLVLKLTDNFRNFDLDEHTDLIYSVYPYTTIDKTKNHYIASSHAYMLPLIFKYMRINDEIDEFVHDNKSDQYQSLFYQELCNLYTKNQEFNHALTTYLKPDIDCYASYEILSNERAIQGYFAERIPKDKEVL